MKHATQMQFGRSVKVALTPETSQSIDKWHALNALTEAAGTYDLSHRTLGVLKTLMSFLPDRMIHPMPGEAIVFPSNRTLAHRLNGMPDSTLRRHLARLVQLGIVSRYDSPNRKRYARRVGQGGIAFGFDLSPIARQSPLLLAEAQAARDAKAKLQALRAEVAMLRQSLIDTQGQGALSENARLALRRKPDETELQRLGTALRATLDALDTPKLSAPDARNERHIHVNSKYNSDSETPAETIQSLKKENHSGKQTEPAQNTRSITLQEVTHHCSEYQNYFPDKLTQWPDLVRIGERLAQMLGIDSPVFLEACRVLGAEHAAIVVLCILENHTKIHNPGGYLRRISQQARAGGFDVKPMLHALARP